MKDRLYNQAGCALWPFSSRNTRHNIRFMVTVEAHWSNVWKTCWL